MARARRELSKIPMPKKPSENEEEMSMLEEFPELEDGEDPEMEEGESESLVDLTEVSDEDLLAEAQLRGLVPESDLEEAPEDEEGIEDLDMGDEEEELYS